ncbi:hypothetical protein BT96DRAFT_503738 [Gymnopus androsaceus JB14]|uniref:Uncharacterized protein n=1 Tax=Gymnopus androsaceus JB14 TaxID=1447944 RepID=A0A6A4HV15_9AGAR|nr:hypothetical protein BT96DRAFT_503738 [Gymnopus androsaceus JB14]
MDFISTVHLEYFELIMYVTLNRRTYFYVLPDLLCFHCSLLCLAFAFVVLHTSIHILPLDTYYNAGGQAGWGLINNNKMDIL